MNKTIFLLFCFILLSSLSLQSQDAPVTTAGRVTNATPGNHSVPVNVTVTNFINIGQFMLTMTFDTTRVRYVSASTNPSLTGMTVTYSSPPPTKKNATLIFAWPGSANVSLADGSSIVDLTFHYVTGTGILSWVYSDEACQYKRYDGATLTTLNDNPEYLFYLNGGISNRTAPVTFAPNFPNPVPGSMLPVNVTVNGFTGIGALTLYLEYDPAVIIYQNSFTKNLAFGSSFEVGDVSGFGSNRLIIIQWYGSAVTLADGSTLCTLKFNYPSASCDPCALSWFDSGPSCEYADSSDVLIDMPQSAYYINGLVAESMLYTWTGTVSSAWNNAGNWNACGIPDITRQVVIPNVSSPNSFPIITVSASCKSIRIQTGATLSVGPTGSITVGDN